MPVGTWEATWQPSSPALRTYEGPDGLLETDYGSDVDHRWPGRLTLGPALTAVDCSGAGGTAADVNGFATSGAMNATLFLYAIRGTKWAKIKVSDLSLVSDGTETELGEAATHILYVKGDTGTEEIVVGMAGTAFRRITAVGAGATDTHSANSSGYKVRIFGRATPADTIAMLGKGTGTTENLVQFISLTGGASMNSTAATKTTLSGEQIQFTAFGLDAGKWILGTSNGPYNLDPNFGEFEPMMDEIQQSTANCVGMMNWYPKGLLIPTARGLRFSQDLEGHSIGLETRRDNGGDFMGPFVPIAVSERWAYGVVTNPVTGTIYLACMRPALLGDHHGEDMSYFCLRTLSSACAAGILMSSQFTGRTLDTLVIGDGSNIRYANLGRTDRELSDTSYTYATSGTWYGTEGCALHASGRGDLSGLYKRVEWVKFETSNVTAAKTVELKMSYDGGTAVSVYKAGDNGYDGLQQHGVPESMWASGRRIKPSIVFASDSASSVPSVNTNMGVTFGGSLLAPSERYP